MRSVSRGESSCLLRSEGTESVSSLLHGTTGEQRTSSDVAHFSEVTHVVRLNLALDAIVLRPPSFKLVV